ncbi:V-ATPase proteolipid subunit [Carpediemonas membranifera]|uniref:V-type proton ATPase proteolipid subunit n=1 Tax=Carpediemonas membranifera TaxID=201153 RepID=A0A8J6DZD4_9EUKA|nr:V-ATPase proteolipid subunit [Carpediemonas membranifera]|eukprot:KAG9393474.1 V-ATPase proteolipid subunit [Carpediemonas membranifera]
MHYQRVMATSDLCPASAPFFGFMGVAAAIGLSCLGAAYGTAKSGVGIVTLGVQKPGAVIKHILPVLMAGMLGIYGLITSFFIMLNMGSASNYPIWDGFAHLAAGLSVGVASLASGIAIGITGDAVTRAIAREPKLFIGMILLLVFGEVLGLYGMIVSVIMVATLKSGISC